MQKADIRTQWEGAAPGWARWEATVATWMEPATEAMLTMAGVVVGGRFCQTCDICVYLERIGEVRRQFIEASITESFYLNA
jgi:hypothetical protein